LSFVQFISLIAWNTGSWSIPWVAVVRNWNTDTLWVEGPSVRAGEADLSVPIPGLASQILWLNWSWQDALSLDDFVSLVAWNTGSWSIELVAVVRNWNANTLWVEGPSGWALKTNLSVPIPSFTSQIFWLGNSWQNTFSLDDFVSLEAWNTGSWSIKLVAVVGNWNANTLWVEGPSGWALKANLSVPIPSLASQIFWLNWSWQNTFSLDDFVSLEAWNTGSWGIELVAVVRNWNTDTLWVEGPSVRAGEADLSVPIPGLASQILWLSDGWQDALSIVQFISLIAWNTGTWSIPWVAVVRNWNTDTLWVEGPSVRAGKADLSVPIPGLASQILWLNWSWQNTFSIDDFVSLEAWNAGSWSIELVAVVRNWNTDTLWVEGPSVRAGEANLSVPIPSLASQILWLSNGWQDTFSLDDFVSLEAWNAGSWSIKLVAVVRNWNADTLWVEGPSGWALKANLSVPIPGLASQILWLSDGWQNTFSLNDFITLEAWNAGSWSIELVAVVRNWNADTLWVEGPSVRAGEADLSVPIPGLASQILWLNWSWQNTFSIDDFVSLEAWSTSSWSIKLVAVVRNWNADTLWVEGPSFRAGEADLSVPIPSLASQILWLSDGWQNALSLDDFVSLEAWNTGSWSIELVAVVRNWNADTLWVEGPSVRAGQANLSVPIPGLASQILWLNWSWQNTFSIDDFVSLEAWNTGSWSIELVAVVRNWNTDTLWVEGPSVRAGEADLSVPIPGLASQILWLNKCWQNALSFV
jgi:hypothetical protein